MPLPHNIAIVSLTREVSTRSLLQVSRGAAEAGDARLRADLGVPGDRRRVRGPDVGPERLPPGRGVRRSATSSRTSSRSRSASARGAAGRRSSSASSIAGIHLNAFTRQPFALVRGGRTRGRVVLSHEVLEMLADPSGNRLIAARASDANRSAREVPASRSATRASRSGTRSTACRWSDFYTPRYFDPVARYRRPLQLHRVDRAAAPDPRRRLRHVPRPARLGALPDALRRRRAGGARAARGTRAQQRAAAHARGREPAHAAGEP